MVEKKIGKAGVKVSTEVFRRACRDYAAKQVDRQREEFIRLSPNLIRRNRVDRFGFNSWNQLTEHLRFDGRINYFDDQDTDGVSGNLRFSLRDVLFSQGEVSLDLFANEGSFTEGHGFRLGANRYFDGFYLNLSYEWAEYDTQVLIGGSPDLIQQAILASTNFRVASSTDISLNLDYRFGDSQNAFTLGVYSTTRF
jgi:hypothetical protein